ncbi:MAG: DNA-directed RNA polymerase subunit N [Candidatus Hodarchaeales archaeon]
MLIPIRCYTCGNVIADLYDEWVNKLKEGIDPKEILDGMIGMQRMCCRRMLVTHVEILDETIKFSLTSNKLRFAREM